MKQSAQSEWWFGCCCDVNRLWLANFGCSLQKAEKERKEEKEEDEDDQQWW